MFTGKKKLSPSSAKGVNILHSHTAFTLLEIMITIAILGMLYVVTLSFTGVKPQTYKEKMTRVASYLEDEIKNARQNTMIGKGFRSSTGLIIPVKERNIYISPNTIRTEYTRADNSMTGTERELRYPFFDGDKDYQIRDISVYAVKPTVYTYNSAVGNESFSGLTNIILIFGQNGDITATNSEIATDTQGSGIKVRSIEMVAGYKYYESRVQLDRLAGVVNTSSATSTGTPIVVIPATYGECATTGNTCITGTAVGYSAGTCGGYQTWSCTGSNGGTNSNCSLANLPCPINGACGITNASYLTPTSNFCNTGIGGSILINSTSWTWNCTGLYGGTTANCTMPKIIDGVCGTANGKAYIYTTTTYGSDIQCSVGTSTNTSFPGNGATVSWTCPGVNGGLSPTCSASRDNTPVNGTCGTANGKTYTYGVTSYGSDTQCGLGNGIASVTTFPSQGGSVNWTCGGLYGGSASTTCSASRDNVPINGVCNNSTNFACSSGTSASNVAGSCGGSATWSCNGLYGGTNATNCSKTNATCINGTCNSIFNSYTTPTATCATGNPSAVSGTGPWTWGCNSPNGGTSTTANACSANKTVDCVGAWGVCSNGSQTYTISTSAANGGTACLNTNGAVQSCGTPAVCNNSTQFACSVGTSVSNVAGSCGGSATWGCNSVDGGINTTGTACSKANAACPIVGFCGGSANTCIAGTPSGYSAGSCGGSQTWSCIGSNGGSTASCIANAVCTSGPYSYGGWSACSASCGGGTQTRTQSCSYDSCNTPQATSQSCNTQGCLINGGWSGWNYWFTSDNGCGGYRYDYYIRYCNNPTPANGGADCGSDYYTYVPTTYNAPAWNQGQSCYTGYDGGWTDPYAYYWASGQWCTPGPYWVTSAYCGSSDPGSFCTVSCGYHIMGTIQCNGSCQ